MQSLHGPTTPPVAFSSQTNRNLLNQRGHGSRFNRGGTRGRGRGRGGRTPHCQLCRTDGHYANNCPNLSAFAQQSTSPSDLAKAFHAQCHVTNSGPDWVGDTGATDHMADPTVPLINAAPYKGPLNETGGGPRSM
ncbi:putative transcription factor interactor and regulator CCHC(Zn) family [Helianthus debilis subsp. tardiflorus]